MKLRRIFTSITASLVVFALPVIAQAQQFELFAGEASGRTDFRVYIQNFYRFAISASILIATVLIMIGGIMWVTSAGNPSRIEKAKSYIIDSIIGVVLLMAAYTILQVINPQLVNLTLPSLQKNFTIGACVITEEQGSQYCYDGTINQCLVLKGRFTQDKKCAEICATRTATGQCLGGGSETSSQQLRAAQLAGKPVQQAQCEAQSSNPTGVLIDEDPNILGGNSDETQCNLYCQGAGAHCVIQDVVDNDEGAAGNLIRCWCQYTGPDRK